jgi:phospholipid/cholesterol/gamma-HCH transport system substrate-binding protein
VKPRQMVIRLTALLVVGVVAFAFIAFDVVQWRLGAQDYEVTVVLPRAGGIYPEAVVAYRGVTVGTVTALHLMAHQVDVEMAISPGTRIPIDSSAAVRELTAAGEQYLDLVPNSPGAPYLRNGDVIRNDVTVPVTVGAVLSDTGSLLRSLNGKDIQTINQALATGFGGTGGSLRSIVVAGQNAIQALEQAEPSTVQLIVDGRTVLTYLDATNNDLAQFSQGLDSLTNQIKNSNSDIVALLGNGVAAQNQVSALLNQDAGTFQSLTDNLATVGNVGESQQQAMQALFQVLPVFAQRIGTTASNGKINVELYFNTNNPVCTYVPGSSMPSPTQATGAPDLNRTCSSPAAGTLERGAGDAPGAAGG